MLKHLRMLALLAGFVASSAQAVCPTFSAGDTDYIAKLNQLSACASAGTSPLTTKGDLWGYSSADARIPVGANNRLLMADSAQTLGVAWTAAINGVTIGGTTPAAGAFTTLSATGNVGLGVTATARLHIDNGTTSAGSAPLKIDSGSLMSMQEAGAIENNGSHLYYTDDGPNRRQLVDTTTIQTITTGKTFTAVDIGKIGNLTSNGFVKTGSGDGTLSIDTTTYVPTTVASPAYSSSITQSITGYSQINIGTLTGNLTLTLSGGIDGQAVRIRFKQDGTGSRLLTLDSKFRLGADITSVTLSTAANKIDYLGVIYHSSDDKYDVVAFVKGY